MSPWEGYKGNGKVKHDTEQNRKNLITFRPLLKSACRIVERRTANRHIEGTGNSKTRLQQSD